MGTTLEYSFMSARRKKGAQLDKPRLGRPGNHLKMGIVGLPNVGKSTLFNVLSGMDVIAANYPFATIDPAEARVAVPDPDFDYLCEKFSPASEGQGLGNEFLSNIQAVDGIYHVVRVFEDTEITHVEETVDPVRDLQIIRDELIAKDLQNLARELETVSNIRGGDAQTKKAAGEKKALIEKTIALLESGVEVMAADEWTNKEIVMLNTLHLLTAKPAVVLVNMSEKGYRKKKSKFLKPLVDYIKENMKGAPIIPFSGILESTLVSLGEEGAKDYCEGNKVSSAIPKIIWAGREALELECFFTCGADEVRAWTIRQGTKAPQAAGVIHTDFERGFIMAEVYNLADLQEHETEAGVKAAGKYMQKGKDYVVQNKDIVFFKFNVSK